MATPTPEPGQAGVTYVDIPVIRLEIATLDANSPNSQVNGIWNGILSRNFPSAALYFSEVEGNRESYDFYDFRTFQFRADGSERDFFLETQCGPFQMQDRQDIWEEGEGRIGRYLKERIGRRPVGERTPIYGILAIGVLVTFLQYDDEVEDVVAWSPRFHLLEDKDEVQAFLNSIRSDH